MKNKRNFITLDELAKKYLKPDVLSSLSDINIEAKGFDVKLVVEKVELQVSMNTFKMTTFIIILLILFVITLRG